MKMKLKNWTQIEVEETENSMNEILGELKLMLLPVDEDDERSAFLVNQSWSRRR